MHTKSLDTNFYYFFIVNDDCSKISFVNSDLSLFPKKTEDYIKTKLSKNSNGRLNEKYYLINLHKKNISQDLFIEYGANFSEYCLAGEYKFKKSPWLEIQKTDKYKQVFIKF